MHSVIERLSYYHLLQTGVRAEAELPDADGGARCVEQWHAQQRAATRDASVDAGIKERMRGGVAHEARLAAAQRLDRDACVQRLRPARTLRCSLSATKQLGRHEAGSGFR
eukprot:1566497-Pleurochrysis_carterae.AAC.2